MSHYTFSMKPIYNTVSLLESMRQGFTVTLYTQVSRDREKYVTLTVITVDQVGHNDCMWYFAPILHTNDWYR